MQWPEEQEADDTAGALVVEMAPVLAATPVDLPDVAHGPLTQEAVLTPQASQETVTDVAKDIPLVEPSPAPEPEVALPTPRPEAKEEPKEQEAKEPVPGTKPRAGIGCAADDGAAAGRSAAGAQRSAAVTGQGAQSRTRTGELAEAADQPSQPPQTLP